MQDVLAYETYFFDLDGTIFIGDLLLPGVRQTLQYLREQGKQVLFLSNTTIRTREECRNRLRLMGIEARTEEMVTAASVSAAYFREMPEMDRRPQVLVIGEQALKYEMADGGTELTDEPMEATHVLVGMDRDFDYEKLHRAMKAVRAGAYLIAANPDPNCPVVGDLLPDTWAMVKAIEAASCGTVQEIIGKPSAYYAEKVLELSGTRRENCLMVGDRMDTDIRFGLSHGINTALVLTGVTAREDLEQYSTMPDHIWTSMSEMLQDHLRLT
ncbi:Arabinose operon protein AraL [compost metagenome]